MKRICFITTTSSTLKAFVLNIARHLEEYGDYSIFIICDLDDTLPQYIPSTFTYLPIKMKRGVSLLGLFSIFKMISIFIRYKFDIVQYSTPNASFYASLASKIAGIKVRLYCQWGIKYVAYSGVKRWLLKYFEKLTCYFSTWIEPDSHSNLQFSHKEGLYKPEKSSVVWNGSAKGVNLKKFDIAKKFIWRNEILSEIKINPNNFIIGFVGRVTRDKGIEELLSAIKVIFEQFQDITLLIVGEFDENHNIDQDLLNWAMVNKNIVFYGGTNQVEKFFSCMDIFVLPSYREGFGSVLIEAQALGVPVITTNIPGPIDAILIGKTGLVIQKKNVQSLVDAILTLYVDPQLRITMGKEGRIFVSENFSDFLLYQKILEDRNRLIERGKYD